LKIRHDEQSLMKSGRSFQARGPATARSPLHVRGVTGSSWTDEDDDRSAVDVVKWLQSQAEWLFTGSVALNRTSCRRERTTCV